jgi:hypothetical protein
MTRKLLDLAGIGRDRLHLQWVSSAEAQRFAEVAFEVAESIKNQGPLDHRALDTALDACELTVSGETLRWLVGKEIKITAKGDIYGRRWPVERYETFLDRILEREYHKNLIYVTIKHGAASVREVSHKTGLDLKRVSYLLADLEKTGRVEFRGMRERKAQFAAL